MKDVNSSLNIRPFEDSSSIGPVLTQIFERHFGRVASAPTWLRRPLEALQAAFRADCDSANRLRSLTYMAAQLDSIYATHQADFAEPSTLVDVAEKISPRSVTAWAEILLDYAANLMQVQILPELFRRGLRISEVAQLGSRQRTWLHEHFVQHIYPLLTPLAVDPGRPFPYISSDSLNLLVDLHKPNVAIDETGIISARIKVPRATPRLIALPADGRFREQARDGGRDNPTHVWSGDVVRTFMDEMFTGIPVNDAYYFRVLRYVEGIPFRWDQDGKIRLPRQGSSPVVRLDVDNRMPEPLLDWLVEHLGVAPVNVIRYSCPLDMMCLSDLSSYVNEDARLIDAEDDGNTPAEPSSHVSAK